METKNERVPLDTIEPGPSSEALPPAPLTPDQTAPSNVAQGVLQATVEDIQTQVVEVLKTCYDPEVPVNIYELGLVYGIDIQADHSVTVRMTLTSPMCPAAGTLPPEVQAKVSAIPGVASAKVDIVWDPPWNPQMISPEGKERLGMA